ncbi:hypothetical protein POM88_054783 [Heracleum sosnowskyi]|uniref:Uncharacterized protein n=1 Tax=Heracleum sosnowskyi TaxID=360622 RepID=A0AAD8GN22_9APIA|nr:hypothetical protein POM88_054783 [Heracleum sosnowskyi]
MIPSLRDSKKRRHRSNKGNSVGCATTELQTLHSYSGRYNGQVKGEIRRLSTGPLIFLPMGKEDIISFSSVCGSELESLSQTCRRYWKKQSTEFLRFTIQLCNYALRRGIIQSALSLNLRCSRVCFFVLRRSRVRTLIGMDVFTELVYQSHLSLYKKEASVCKYFDDNVLSPSQTDHSAHNQ